MQTEQPIQLSPEEQKIAQEITDRIEENPQFFQNFLNKTEKISGSIYEKSPIKSELLVKNVQKLDGTLETVASLMDKNLNKTLEVYNNKKQSLTEGYQTQKGKMQTQFQAKSSEIQNNLINTVSNQLYQIKGFVSQTNISTNEHSDASEKSQEDQLETAQNTENINQRYIELWKLAISIFENVELMQFALVKNNLPVKKFQEIRIFQSIIFDLFNEKLNTPYFVPAYNKSLALRDDALAKSTAFKQQSIQYFQNQRQLISKLNLNDSKVFVTVQLENGKKFAQNLIPTLKQQSEVLKGAIVKVYGDYFTIQFCKEFYSKNQVQIAEALKKVQATIQQSKQKSLELVQQGKQRSLEFVQSSKNTYAQALEEFKRRKAELYEIQPQQQEVQQQQEQQEQL